MCSGIWIGRSQGVKLDLVGAVYEMEERKNGCEGIREEASKHYVYTHKQDPMALAVRFPSVKSL